MKKIIVKNNLAFAACQLSQSKDETRRHFTMVLMPIRPGS